MVDRQTQNVIVFIKQTILRNKLINSILRLFLKRFIHLCNKKGLATLLTNQKQNGKKNPRINAIIIIIIVQILDLLNSY